MNEPKPFASLSSGLLARKGAAKPAMRPQGLGQLSAGIEDLGWNDMGYAPPVPEAPRAVEALENERAPSPISALTPMGSAADAREEDFESSPPIVEQQRAAIAASFAERAEDEESEEEAEDEGDDEGEISPVLAIKAPKSADVEPEDRIEMADPEMPEPDMPEPEMVQAEPAPAVALPVAVPARVVQNARSKAAFTLRLEAERHLKLRLACAVTGQSAQQLVTEALDRLLETRPEIEALAGQVPMKAAKNR